MSAYQTLAARRSILQEKSRAARAEMEARLDVLVAQEGPAEVMSAEEITHRLITDDLPGD